MGTPSKWDFFTVEELTCHCGCGQMLMDDWFMQDLVALRRASGIRMPVSSGYRCPAHNALVSKTGDDGPHTTGKAVDIRIAGTDMAELVKLAINAGFLGVGQKQHGLWAGRYIHLDKCDRGKLTMWTYP